MQDEDEESASGGAGSIDAEVEMLVSQAVKKKGMRDYSESGRLFLRAAKVGDGSGKAESMQAAGNYVEAAKCFAVLKQTDASISANLSAARIYHHHSDTTWSRAAALYEKIAASEKERHNLPSALTYLDESLALYRNAGDPRAVHIDMDRAAILCLLDRFNESAEIYDRLASHCVTIPTLQFNLRAFLTSALFCDLALQNQQGIKERLQRYAETYPSFADVEPVWRMLVHAWDCGDLEVFESVEGRFWASVESLDSLC
ncbi:hypothetical protein HDU98_007800 [Podochytrium sp. JEL0797]|nr:hypothetical protein HDU98_007800 [Podochytrium sp. JEL0797]